MRGLAPVFPLLASALVLCGDGRAMDLVKDGKALATVVVSTDDLAPPGRSGKNAAAGLAHRLFVEWIRKITDVELAVTDRPPQNAAAVFIGKAAVEAGLKLDDIPSPSREGLRIVCEDQRILVGGQNGTATTKAVCRLLEELGCRYFMDGPLGEVYPRQKDLSVKTMTLTEKPGLVYRRIWGPEGSFSNGVWAVWNGDGGTEMQTAHAWGAYAPVGMKDHPEYFALRKDGRREPSDWVCTSNPDLRAVFADRVVAAARGGRNPSLSPPDGVGYCQCPACKAQDDPTSIEPSSGSVCVTNRYTDFFSFIAGRVAKECPDSILSFYCYADYTQPPTNGKPLAPNLCAWLAPLRYCRLHRTGSPICPSRMQLEQMADGWAAVARQIALRTYNYNCAECAVPFSLLSVWKHDIPYFKKKGCIGINLETPSFWEINGPHIYLSIRLAYNPEADADALMDDFFVRFLGPKAGPLMKDYWMTIDDGFATVPCHAGSFFAVHRVYTPERLAKCQSLLDRAAEAAREDPVYARRVALYAGGFRNAVQVVAIRGAMNKGDFAQAKTVYDDLVARTRSSAERRTTNIYTSRYVERFVGNAVLPGAAALAAPGKLLQVLPDQWRFTYDEADAGTAKGYFAPAFDDSPWRMAATYGDTLEAQGIEENKTFLWYRTSIRVPETHGRLTLYFAEVDGGSTVFVNGKKAAEYTDGKAGPKRRAGFEVGIDDCVKPGDNVVAVRVDHRKISELALGGILRPVLLIDKGP